MQLSESIFLDEVGVEGFRYSFIGVLKITGPFPFGFMTGHDFV